MPAAVDLGQPRSAPLKRPESSEADRYDIPVLLIHGVQDVVIPFSRTWELLNIIPNADAHILSQCGHCSQVERSDEFNEVIGRYLSRHLADTH